MHFITRHYIFISFIMILFTLLVIINNVQQNAICFKTPTVETMETMETTDLHITDTSNYVVNSIINTPATSFCNSYLGNSAEIEPACNNLTQQHCNQTSCCVFSTNNNNIHGKRISKCVAGDIQGPTYKTDLSGTNIPTETYYFKGKRYGQ